MRLRRPTLIGEATAYTADVHGGDDLQIQFMATAAFIPNLDVIP